MSTSPRPVCLDASFLIHLVTHGEHVAQAATLWHGWHGQERVIIAPSLIFYEISNALYRYIKPGMMSVQDAELILDRIVALSITTYRDFDLHCRALEVAEKYTFPAAYDAHYLALAQRLDADFWTADRRLFNAVHEALPWVHLLQ